MKKICLLFAVMVFVAANSAFCFGLDELSEVVSSVSISAKADLPGFKADISAEFGTPIPKIDALIAVAPTPGDAYMAIQISNITKKPPEEVLTVYKAKKDKGWGAIAHELGIKPGSPEFHALKSGKYAEKSKGNKAKAKDMGGGGKGGKKK